MRENRLIDFFLFDEPLLQPRDSRTAMVEAASREPLGHYDDDDGYLKEFYPRKKNS